MTARPRTSRTDTALLILTGVCVTGLAVVAGAVSFAHMRELAAAHDQTGWKSYAFPISVDGLEIVASLYLVAQRRAGRPTGWVPWAALAAGTSASLAANIAVGGDDLVGQALAGWPALSMLAAVKLLFGMFDHANGTDPVEPFGPVVPDDARPVPDVVPDGRRPVRDVPDGSAPVPDARDDRRAVPDDHRTDRAGRPGRSPVPGDRAAPVVDPQAVADLIPAAYAARDALFEDGRGLSRDALATALRCDGHALSNARASLLTKLLREEDRSASEPLV